MEKYCRRSGELRKATIKRFFKPINENSATVVKLKPLCLVLYYRIVTYSIGY